MQDKMTDCTAMREVSTPRTQQKRSGSTTQTKNNFEFSTTTVQQKYFLHNAIEEKAIPQPFHGPMKNTFFFSRCCSTQNVICFVFASSATTCIPSIR